MAARFQDRTDAGRYLARVLSAFADEPDLLVLALPRGGVPVGFEVARALHAPLDVFLVRKLGVPGREELAMGAIASGGVRVLNEPVTEHLQLSPEVIDSVAAREQQELERRERLYRGDRPMPKIRGRTVILVDDGLATGATMRAAAAALRQQHPARLVVGVPVAAPETCDELRDEVDQVVCAVTPEPFYAVGLWYDDFSQTTDAEVRELLELAAQFSPPLVAAETNVSDTPMRRMSMSTEHDSRDRTGARKRPESGNPGGGQGRRDEVGGSGVYPASAGKAPEDSVLRTQAEWGQGDRGAAGAEDAGQSELHFSEEEIRAATGESEEPEEGEQARRREERTEPGGK